MRVLLCWSFYDAYLKNFFAKTPRFADLPYDDQYQLLLGDYFGVPGSYARWMCQLGHEAVVVVNNCEPMQRRWAQDHGVPFPGDWQRTVALEQVKRFQPDVFFMGSMFGLYGDFLDDAKRRSRKCVGWIACPTPNDLPLGKMDLILSSAPLFVERFRGLGVASELQRPAFDPDLLARLPPAERDISFSFVGGVSPDHRERSRMLRGLADRTPLEVWGYGFEQQGLRAHLKNLLSFAGTPRGLAQRHRGEVWGLDMYRVLQRSKITFNSHIDVAGDSCGNMRMFEATGIGTLLLTDRKKNLSELFEPGREVAVYDGLDDAVERVEYFLGHGAQREAIARAGQERTLREHTMRDSVARMIDSFRALFRGKGEGS